MGAGAVLRDATYRSYEHPKIRDKHFSEHNQRSQLLPYQGKRRMESSLNDHDCARRYGRVPLVCHVDMVS